VQIFDTWNRIAVWLVALLAVAALGWLIWHAWQFWLAFRVLRVYSDEQFSLAAITPQHVEALRKLQFAWEPRMESGGPVVDRFTPYGGKSIAADLEPIIGRRDPVAVAKFHREIYDVLIWALEHRTLSPGPYRLEHLTNAAMERRLRQELTVLPTTRIEEIVAELPRLEPDGYFHFTDQHRRLLQRLRFDWPNPQSTWMMSRGGYPVPEVHFKRPFGDMSNFYTDMADILELSSRNPSQIDPMLDRLYWEMWPALQTFVEHATIDAPTAFGIRN
jgi:hypothetical protein